MSKIKLVVTHLGEDYGKVEVTDVDGHKEEYEVSLPLAQALDLFLEEIA